MKKLNDYMNEKLIKKNRKYHLSYDTINCDKDFNSYNEARTYLLCVLSSTPFIKIESYNNSSIILEYEINQYPKLFKYLAKHLGPFFYYSISSISKNIEYNHVIQHHKNVDLNTNLQNEIKNLSCKDHNKKIAQY